MICMICDLYMYDLYDLCDLYDLYDLYDLAHVAWWEPYNLMLALHFLGWTCTLQILRKLSWPRLRI